jgi:hypothetical protein
MKDFAVSHAFLPLGSRLWTFGSANLADSDGWSGDAGTTLTAGKGYVDLRASGPALALLSPGNLAVAPTETDLMVIAADPIDSLARVGLEGRSGQGPWIALGAPSDVAALQKSPAGLQLPIAWPADVGTVDQFRLSLETRGSGATRLRHVAIYPRADRATAVR